MTKLKVLGTGSSGNCYLLECDGKTIILDAGIGLKEIKIGLDFNISKVSGAFISHIHQDHSKSADALRNMGIPVFEPYLTENTYESADYDGFRIRSFPLPHDGVSNRGCLITCPDGSKVLYMTDYEYCEYTFKKQNIETMLIECNYSMEVSDEQANLAHVLRGHASLDVTKGIIAANKTDKMRTVIACHLSEKNADSAQIKTELQEVAGHDVNVWIARKGLEVET